MVTVLPGDVILARREGVIVIPAHLAEEVVVTAEVVALKDEFGHLRLREGVYTPGQIDVPWTAPIKADFFRWLRSRPDRPPIADAEIEKHLVTRFVVRCPLSVQAIFESRRADGGLRSPARISRMRRPTIASSPGCIIQTPITSGFREPGLTSMLGLPSRSFFTISDGLTLTGLRVPADVQVRHRVGDLRHDDLGPDVLEFLEGLGDPVAAVLPLLPDGGMVLLQVRLEGHEHADDLFLVDLVRPAEGVAVGAVVELGRVDQVLAAQQEP